MEAAGEQDSPTKTVTAAPITAVIAKRVKELRDTADLSGPKLALRLNKLGVPWNRTTIAKFETGARHSITVQELLALSLALDVPVPMLLSDPRHVDEVPLAEGVAEPAWHALMWLVGREQIHIADVSPGSQDEDAMAVVHAGWEILEATSELTVWEVRGSGRSAAALEEIHRRDAARHRDALVRINRALDRLRSREVPYPELLPLVVERAKELDFKLLPELKD